jgi:hypothetical protein
MRMGARCRLIICLLYGWRTSNLVCLLGFANTRLDQVYYDFWMFINVDS